MATQGNFATDRISYISILFHAICLYMLVITGFTSVAAQPGFLSIDCGTSEAYIDDSTGISWETDAKYISSGRNVDYGTVRNPLDPSWNITKQLGTVRYFHDPRPKRNRDCYSLPSTPQKRYIIRPTFASTEASSFGLNYISSEFDLYLNSTLVRKIQLDYDSAGLFYPIEIIFLSPGNVINLCLVRRAGDSFINSLELRELKDEMYSYAGKTSNGETIYLYNVVSAAFGSSRSFYRYPDDAYDRYWYTANSDSDDDFQNFSDVSNSSNILASTSEEAPDLPPVSVMKQALVSYNSTSLDFVTRAPAALSYVNFFFQELDGNASTTNVRGMDVFVSDQHIGSLNNSNQALELQALIPDSNVTTLKIKVAQASWSRLPPMLNAAELYSVRNINKSRTAQEDVSTVAALETRLPQLSEGKGDPCFPVPFSWLECSADGPDPTNFQITSLFLDNVNVSGPIPREIFMLTGLTAVSLSNANLKGSIPDMAKLPRLQNLSLRNNYLDGDIQNFRSLVQLQELYLDNNSFTGGIPTYFSSFPNLTELHVDNNNFSGVIPAGVKNKMGLSFSFANNPALKLTDPSSGLSNGAVVGIIFGSLFGLVLLATITWYLLTRKRRATAKILQEIHKAGSEGPVPRGSTLQSVSGGQYGSLRVFTLRQVSEATEKFSKKIGEGSFGSVFYGRLPDGREVAVKVKKEASRQGRPEFINELELLSRVHHRNLVSLVGYCEEGLQQILLYAYLPNGTLEEHLHGSESKSKTPLPWKVRLNVAVNSATGLEYLHFHCNPQIIHRDVKSANILLDQKMVAKVADFGISKQAMDEITTGVNTAVKGTFGYMDPELFLNQRLTRSNDVYSFGIVLLEIISGCHPHPMQLRDGRSLALTEWVRNCVRDGNAFDVFDPTMENKFSYQSARMVLDLALQCSNPVLSRRPDMRQVVRALAQAEQQEDAEQSWMLAGGDDDPPAEAQRNYRPGGALEELENEDYSTTRELLTIAEAEPSTQKSTHVPYDTADVEAR